MLWTEIQQEPIYQMYNNDTSNATHTTTNTELLSSTNEFKYIPQPTSDLYDPQVYYAANTLPQQQAQTPQTTTIATVRSAGSISSSSTEDEDLAAIPRPSGAQNRKRKINSVVKDTDDEKRKHFLERNRQAALKCRQRKKQWLTNLQERVEFLANDNEQLQLQASVMRDEVINLRNMLLAHKNCPIMTNLPPQYHALYHNNKVFVE